MKIGVVGAGFIGRALARLAVANGHEVMIANSRGPQTLTSTAIALHCHAGTVEEAARFGEVVVMAIPLHATNDLPAAPFAGKIVMDANNYYPKRDGDITELASQQETTGGFLARRLVGAKVVKAFNAILQDDIEKDARPPGSSERRALPIAGDDVEAKLVVAKLVDQFGFEPFDAGAMEDSWRFERAMPAYCVSLQTDELKEALAAAQRGVEVPDGFWRARRAAEHAAHIAVQTRAPATQQDKRQGGGFEGRGSWDIVDTQFHLGPQHDAKASLAAMDALGIRSALVDELWGFDAQGQPQPSAALEGGIYRSLSPLTMAASLQYPSRFSFIQRIELGDPHLLSRIRLLAQTPGCRCLRINLFSDNDRKSLADGKWDDVFALAQQLEMPVAVMSEQAGTLLAPIARRFIDLALIVDHCGWVRTPQQWEDVLKLGRLPNVYLKWSHAHRAFRRFNNPEQARHQALVNAVEAFGASRVMWAGDVSFEESNATWSELLSFVRDHSGLSEDDRAWVLGGTARKVHQWKSGQK
jgi:predicted dinucleotide-binding enzyme/predicted TIM-barrel fold metal-dependent hydrolase